VEKVTVIIPVKDEEDGLRFLVENFEDSDFRKEYEIDFIFVIDGRTSDDSRNFATQLSGKIIDQRETHGKGAAIRQAVEFWKRNPTPYTVFLDADGSYSFESVGLIVDKLVSGADVTSGSRFLSKKHRPRGMSRLHYFGNIALSQISSVRNRRKISDLCTGLWGFNYNALNSLNIMSKGFDLEAEIVGLIRRNKLKHEEISVSWSQRKGGASKLNSIRDGTIILLRILRT
jgi:dolichol-phosphate mannosyltransferase